jgi:peptidoglycan hydrolase-like protein with peptidoglycan-binding domain
MKNFILTITFILTAFISNAQNVVVNDNNAQARQISGSFNAIKVSGGIDIYISQSESEAVAVSATEQQYRDEIRTVIENGTLNVYYDSNRGWSKGNKKLKVYISFKNLERLEASGASDVHAAGTITVPSLSLNMSGASSFKGAVNINTLAMELSGASTTDIKGNAKNVTIQSSGASDVKAYDLSAENCTAKATGASDINITVNKELNVHASGASDVYYKGSCVIKDLHSSGASTVARKG